MTWEEAVLWLRSQPEQAELVRACFFDDPLRFAAERYYLSTEWTEVTRYLPPRPGMALDLGAGRGIASYALARDGWRVVALEPNGSGVVGAAAIRALAFETGLDIEVRQEAAEDLPFKDGEFDLVFGRQVLHHARDLKLLCREARRVLRPGGVFMAVREHVISKKRDLKAFLDAHPLHRHYGGEYAYLLSEYKEAIEQSGIRLTRVLNSHESNINLFPDSLRALTARLAAKFRLPSASFVPSFVPPLLGAIANSPGRAFTFVGENPHG